MQGSILEYQEDEVQGYGPGNDFFDDAQGCLTYSPNNKKATQPPLMERDIGTTFANNELQSFLILYLKRC
jgi:hypothetical protein